MKRRRYEDNYLKVQYTSKSEVSVMMWGFIGFYGEGEIKFIERSMNGTEYIKVLQDTLLPNINFDSVFQDDNAPCHRSSAVQKFKEDIVLPVIDWPAQSPDLNIIENIWHLIKFKVSKKASKNKSDLVKVITSSFNEIKRSDMIKKLYLSIPSRLNAVIKARGQFTKY